MKVKTRQQNGAYLPSYRSTLQEVLHFGVIFFPGFSYQ